MKPGTSSLILFDGVCNLCAWSVRFILPRDPAGRFTFAPLQSEAARNRLSAAGLDADAPASLVLIEDGRIFQESTAALRIARHLRFPWPLLSTLLIVPRVLRDPVYRFLARHRYRWFGRREECWRPDDRWNDRFTG